MFSNRREGGWLKPVSILLIPATVVSAMGWGVLWLVPPPDSLFRLLVGFAGSVTIMLLGGWLSEKLNKLAGSCG